MKFLSILTLCWLALPLVQGADGETFSVGIKQTPPFTIKEEDGKWKGPSVWLLEQILSKIGKTPVYHEMDLPDIFDGLERGQLDAAIAALSITSEREERIDFSHSYFESGIGIAILDKQTEMWILALRNLFSLRFLQAVCGLLLLLAVVGFLIWLAERKTNPEQFGGRPGQGVGNGLWWSAVTMTTVGYGDKAPKTFIGRVLGLGWMFVAIVIISGFTAGFASSLTRDSLAKKVENLHDLSRVKTATVQNSTSADWLASLRIPFKTSSSIEQLLKELEEGKWDAVVYDKPILEYYVARDDLTRIYVLKSTFTRENYGIALPPKSPYLEKIDVLLLRFTQTEAWKNQLFQVLNR